MIDNKGKGKTKRERVGGGHECRECEMGTLRYPHPLTGYLHHASGVTGEERVGGGEWCGEGQRHLHEFRHPHPLTGSPGGGRIRSDEDDRSNSDDSSGEAVLRAMTRRASRNGDSGDSSWQAHLDDGERSWQAHLRAQALASFCSVSPFKGKGKEGTSLGSADEPEWPREPNDDGLYDGQGRYEEIQTARDCYDVDEPLEYDSEEAKTEPENEEKAESEGSAKIVRCPSDDSSETWLGVT